MEALMTSSGKSVYPDYIGTGENLGLPDKLAFLVSYGELFVAVISRKRDNPKRIIDNLVSVLGEGSPISHVGSAQLHADQLPTLLARDFGLDPNRSISLQILSEFSKNLRDQGHRPVVIVKDADRVKERTLRALFSIAEKCQIGLVLFAGPSFLKKKPYKEFQPNIYVCNLSTMNDVELRSYIRQSHEDNLLASNAQIEEILHRSAGSTERIDGLIDELIESPKARTGASTMHFSVIVVMIVAGFVFYGADRFQDNVEESLAIELPAESINSGLESPTQKIAAPKVSTVERSTLSTLEKFKADPSTAVSGTSKSILSKKRDDIKPSKLSMSSERSVEGTVDATVGLSSSLSSPPILSKRVVKDAEPVVSPSQKSSWILSANPTDYTLQIMGSSSEDRIQEFIDSQPGTHAFTYYETSRGGQSWFVLTVGQYRNRDDALAAVSNLPPNIQDQVPWARNVASIRSVLLR